MKRMTPERIAEMREKVSDPRGALNDLWANELLDALEDAYSTAEKLGALILKVGHEKWQPMTFIPDAAHRARIRQQAERRELVALAIYDEGRALGLWPDRSCEN